ncbi:uncharacterized protein LOC127260956 [Andrographis paniculata]|uniref:uncharacterized protein LOC127260956 n=1 Tax=Andrographis paniculata TaxID=175694 RepID=UPI0021E81294|nr:uncharacterized protein LOC127260956 [Andrographis paniculata]
MGFRKHWLMIWVVLLWLISGGSESSTRDSLDSSISDFALKELPKPRTGKLYKVPLSARFSGMEVSVIRLRASSLWKNGVSYGSIKIPPLVLPSPFVRRLDLIYKNLGNWSSLYYSVPNYMMITPVIGFLAYDPNRSFTRYDLIELELMGNNSFIVNFPNISAKGGGDGGVKCVKFDRNGTIEFRNLSGERSCVWRRHGHFSLVVPYGAKGEMNRRRWRRRRRWLVVVVGVAGLIFVIVGGVVIFRWTKGRMMKKMEELSEGGEGLGVIWVGRSRMPAALSVRTQPVLENRSVP